MDPTTPSPPRKKMVRHEDVSGARFLTFSCYKRLPLFNSDDLKSLFVDALITSRARHRFRLLAWVLMPEHIHILMIPQPILAVEHGTQLISSTSTASQALFTLKSSVSTRALIHHTPQLPTENLIQPDGSLRFWQAGGGFDRNIRSEKELNETIAYIHHNPVRRGLVKTPEAWPWSSQRWYLNLAHTPTCDTTPDGSPWFPPKDWLTTAIPWQPERE